MRRPDHPGNGLKRQLHDRTRQRHRPRTDQSRLAGGGKIRRRGIAGFLYQTGRRILSRHAGSQLPALSENQVAAGRSGKQKTPAEAAGVF